MKKLNKPKINKDIYVSDFEPLQLSIGVAEKPVGLEISEPMMNGKFNYHAFQNGLSMHSVRVVEQQSSSNSIELPPGISFNLMFSGLVEFEFAQQKYVMQANDEQASCCAIINPTQEVMKRRMKEGAYVEKLNIFVELSWLELRCLSSIDFEKLNSLISRKQVCAWTPSNKTQKKARELLILDKSHGFTQVLQAEQLTMQVLMHCINDLSQHIDAHQDKSAITTNDYSLSLKALINSQLKEHNSVSQIASALGMSERTLQRRFQRSYGKCVSSYIKQRKMENAKVALLINHKTVGEAAYIAGYKHSSNFINAFKKQTGMTPSAFVRLNS